MKRKAKWITVILAVLVISGAGALAWMNRSISVETATAESALLGKLVKETGTVMARNTVIVSAKHGGEIQGLTLLPGDAVEAGQVLLLNSQVGAQFDVKSLQSQLSGLQTQYRQAKILSDKNKALYEEGALSYEEYAASLTAAKQLASEISALSFNIKSYQETSGTGEIKSPMTGVVTQVFAENGQIAVPGTPLFEIADLRVLYIEAKLIAEDADLVEKDMLVHVKNDQEELIDDKAIVIRIHPKAISTTSELGVTQKRVPVEIQVNSDKTLRLGSDLTVEIITEEKETAVAIPSQCIFEQDQKDWVFVAEGGKAVLRQVETGLEGEDATGQELTEILSGLDAGASVILSPDETIQNGILVKVEP